MKKEIIELAEDVKIFVQHNIADADEMVVFLHPVGGDHSYWQPQMEYFSKNYSVLSCDLRGHNLSTAPKPFNKSISIEAFAEDTIKLIKYFGYHKAHLIGLSMGGVVAQQIYKQHPSVVQSLVLANTWAYQPEGSAKIDFMKEQLSKMSLAESSAMLIPDLFSPATPPEIIKHSIEVEGSKNPEVFLNSWISMFQVDYREMLESIDTALLLIGGTQDFITPTTPLMKPIYEKVTTSQLVDIDGAGHFSNLDHPQEFNRAVAIHLSRARSNRSQKLYLKQQKKVAIEAETVAHALVATLPKRGIECFFSNSGTDFTPIIDALAKFEGSNDFSLKTFQIPHENTAIAMAHGHYLLSGKPQAVMAHVNVGTANMGLGIINAARSHIPMLVLAGKTPWYESDVEGCRTNFVQWGQDTFDQGAYFREFTKWDYELKGSKNLETVIDRALAIAQSDPAGPVYLTLPKEVLCEKIDSFTIDSSPRQLAEAASNTDPNLLLTAAHKILQAKSPLIVTAEIGRYRGGVEALVQLARQFAIPVIEHGKRNFFNFPTEDSMHLGFNPSAQIEQADLIIVIESHVPWIPASSQMPSSPPTVIQIGVDPLCQQIPMRSFPSDITLAGDPTKIVRSLTELLASQKSLEDSKKIAERASLIASAHNEIFTCVRSKASEDIDREKITKRFLSYVIGRVVDDETVIFNEYNLDPFLVPRRLTDSWFENSVASGLGWSLGAALGAQLASPQQTMLVTLGDGSYMFNTPISAHYVASAYRLPILIVVFNDSAWSTIKRSYLSTTKDGWAEKKDFYPLCNFSLQIEFEKLAESCGGVGIKVESPSELDYQLRRAMNIVRSEQKHVLVNVICEPDV
ncbi:MAG: thiamine pyrophosphate-requiring protein [Blastocatellia bacterium]|nr:thiamine pyrophosphate-requiring protein [Blastocatellia bacterium]